MFFNKVIRNNFVPHIKKFTRLVSRDVAVIGVPFGGGQGKDGVEEFPSLFRESGIIKNQCRGQRTFTDYGNIQIPPYSTHSPHIISHNGKMLRNTSQCGEVCESLAAQVEKAAREGKVCLTLGGDHSIVTGSLMGHLKARDNLCVIWIDAHLDFNTYNTSPSGNMHGMSLSFVVEGVKENVNALPGYGWTAPCLNPQNIVYIGVRDPDPEEYELAQKLGILMFSSLDVERHGIENVLIKAMKRINPRLDKPIHVSFDVDVLDPVFCPGTGTPVPGGLTVREVVYIGELINQLGLLAGLDVVEVNPSLCQRIEEKQLTINSTLAIVESFLGK